ncbi:MAG TPA: SDR family NAD(P)-dependent oxidoreductase [Myxococcota bacterium]|nr:SDR family NAD(P)-dependent oxidoreductase [Myxococcota bacterium]
MPRLERCEGRVALVTGGSSGIGEAIARGLAQRGVAVALLSRGSARLDASANRIARGGAVVSTHPCDVGDPAGLQAAIEAAASRHGRLDIVVCSAGIGAHGLFPDTTLETMDAIVRTNVQGLLYTLHFALPHLLARGEGWIVNVSSVAGRLGQPDEAVYSASKFAVTGLSEALVLELAPRGIHVLTLYPGLVRTALFSEEELARLPERVRRAALDPDDVARATLRGLDLGRHEVTIPRIAIGGYLIRTLAPGVFRRILSSVRLGALPSRRPEKG